MLIFSRVCALSVVDWLTIEIEENKSLNFSKGCAIFLVDWLTLEIREYKGKFFQGAVRFQWLTG